MTTTMPTSAPAGSIDPSKNPALYKRGMRIDWLGKIYILTVTGQDGLAMNLDQETWVAVEQTAKQVLNLQFHLEEQQKKDPNLQFDELSIQFKNEGPEPSATTSTIRRSGTFTFTVVGSASETRPFDESFTENVYAVFEKILLTRAPDGRRRYSDVNSGIGGCPVNKKPTPASPTATAATPPAATPPQPQGKPVAPAPAVALPTLLAQKAKKAPIVQADHSQFSPGFRQAGCTVYAAQMLSILLRKDPKDPVEKKDIEDCLNFGSYVYDQVQREMKTQLEEEKAISPVMVTFIETIEKNGWDKDKAAFQTFCDTAAYPLDSIEGKASQIVLAQFEKIFASADSKSTSTRLFREAIVNADGMLQRLNQPNPFLAFPEVIGNIPALQLQIVPGHEAGFTSNMQNTKDLFTNLIKTQFIDRLPQPSPVGAKIGGLLTAQGSSYSFTITKEVGNAYTVQFFNSHGEGQGNGAYVATFDLNDFIEFLSNKYRGFDTTYPQDGGYILYPIIHVVPPSTTQAIAAASPAPQTRAPQSTQGGWSLFRPSTWL